jgi:hypothetical protein
MLALPRACFVCCVRVTVAVVVIASFLAHNVRVKTRIHKLSWLGNSIRPHLEDVVCLCAATTAPCRRHTFQLAACHTHIWYQSVSGRVGRTTTFTPTSMTAYPRKSSTVGPHSLAIDCLHGGLAHTPALSSAAPTHLLARSYVYLATQASTSDRERHATTQVSTSSGASITVVPTTVDERDGVPAQVEDFAKKGYIIYRGWATPAETAAATIEALTTAMIKPKGVLVSGSHMQHSSIPAVD